MRVGVDNCDNTVGVAVFGELAPRDIGGEFTRIDRRAKAFPIVPDGTDVVFVGVGDENTHDIGTAFFQPCDIGHDQVDARGGVHVGEGHAQIDNDQFLFARKSISVDVGVHADLTGPTQGQINQAVSCFFAAHVVSLL